jgi:hypothetical protein
MKRALTLAMLASALLLGASAPAHADTSNGLRVTVDRTRIETKLGHTFAFRSTIANHGPSPIRGLVAHLNVLSFDSAVYVDPEDWSSQRTKYLAPLQPGRSTTVTWKMQAVNTGGFGVYVAVLPRVPGAQPSAGPAIDVTVAKRTTLNSEGILPLALGIPATLGLLALVVRLRRRRL